MVVFDALGAARASCLGYGKPTTPNLDALAAEGALFKRHVTSDLPAQASFTALFTGSPGIATGVVTRRLDAFPPATAPWLPEAFAKAGFRTAASSPLTCDQPYFARGFLEFHDPAAGRPDAPRLATTAATTTEWALSWLERRPKDDPFFLFLHYYDPHAPYLVDDPERAWDFYEKDPADATDSENASLDECRHHVLGDFQREHLKLVAGHVGLAGEVTDLDFVVAQHDACVRQADEGLGKVVDALAARDLLDDTLVVVTADHGESMGEHVAYFNHCGVYQHDVYVPLVCRLPDLFPKVEIDAVTQSIDVAPTIADAVVRVTGRASESLSVAATTHGTSLLPLAKGATKEGHDNAFASQGYWTAKRCILRDGRWKLVHTFDESFWPVPEYELFDLEVDPGERTNVANEKPEMVAELRVYLVNWESKMLRGKLERDPLRKVAREGVPARSRLFGGH